MSKDSDLGEQGPSQTVLEGQNSELAQQQTQEMAAYFINTPVAESRSALRTGLGLFAVGAALTAAGYMSHHSGDTLTRNVPYVPQVQTVMEATNHGLADFGIFALPTTAILLGGAKIAGSRNKKVGVNERISSKELAADSSAPSGLLRRGLEKVGAGTLPVVVIGAVAVGAFLDTIGTEVTNGPSRAFDSTFSSLPGGPGGILITQFKDAMPMVTSNIGQSLGQSLDKEAKIARVPVTHVSMNLGTLDYGKKHFTALTIGENTKAETVSGQEVACNDVPVVVDAAASIPLHSRIYVDGISSIVVGTTSGKSALNRITVEMDPRYIKSCEEQNSNAPDFAIALGTSNRQIADEILAKAETVSEAQLNQGPIPAVTETKTEFKRASEVFWGGNVKSLTDVMALVNGLLSFVSMRGIVGARLLRNREKLSTDLADGVSPNMLRLTEIGRSLKDGFVASVIGNTIAAGSFLVSAVSPGMMDGLDLKAVGVGSSIGILGAVGGTLQKVWGKGFYKSVNPKEFTR